MTTKSSNKHTAVEAVSLSIMVQTTEIEASISAIAKGRKAEKISEKFYNTTRSSVINLAPSCITKEEKINIEANHAYLKAKSFMEMLNITGLSSETSLGVESIPKTNSENAPISLREANFEVSKSYNMASNHLSAAERDKLDRLIAGAALNYPLSLYIRFAEIGQLVDKLYDEEMINTWIRRIGYVMYPLIGLVVLSLFFVDQTGVERVGASGLYGILTGIFLAFAGDYIRRSRVRASLRKLGKETGINITDMRPSHVHLVLKKLSANLLHLGLDIEKLTLQETKELAKDIGIHIEDCNEEYDLNFKSGLWRINEA